MSLYLQLQFAQAHEPGSMAGQLMGQAGSAGVQVVGWGPTTRIVPGENGEPLATNRSTAALRENSVPLNPISIRYRGGIYGADRGVRVGYQGEGPTGHNAAPYYVQPPANRTDNAEQLQHHNSQHSHQPFMPREIGFLHPAHDVRGTPAGLVISIIIPIILH